MTQEITPTPENKTILAGAISFEILSSDVYKKRVILIGENHALVAQDCKGKTTSVSKFIQEQIAQSKSIIDVFIEANFLAPDSKREREDFGNSELGQTMKIFKECLIPSKIKCLFPMLRMHYIDVRSGLEKDENFGHILVLVHEIVKNFSQHIYNQEDFHDLYTLVESNRDYKTIFGRKESILKWIQENTGYSKIVKQMQEIRDEKLRLALQIFIDNEIENIFNQHDIKHLLYNSFHDSLENLQLDFGDPIPKIIIDEIAEVVIAANILFKVAVKYMDQYTLARMFREFKNSNSPSNIIVLAGNYHISTYKRFLLSIGFTSSFVGEKTSVEQCLVLDSP